MADVYGVRCAPKPRTITHRAPMSTDISTLQLARRLADAAILAHEAMPHVDGPSAPIPDAEHWPTLAVLQTLVASESWFYRLTDDAAGFVIDTYEPVPRLLWDMPDAELESD